MIDSSDAGGGISPARARLTHKLRRLRDLHREKGLRGSTDELRAVLSSWIYDEQEHVVLVRPLASVPPAGGGSGVEVRGMRHGDAEVILAFSRAHDPPKVTARVANYLSNGYRAFLGFREGQLIGLFWWVDATIDTEHPDLVLHGIRLEPTDAYGYAYFIAPDERGHATATDFIATVLTELRDAGYERIWGWVLAENLPARWLFALVGYQERRTLRIRTFFSLVTLARPSVLVRNLGWRSRHNFGARVLATSRHSGADA